MVKLCWCPEFRCKTISVSITRKSLYLLATVIFLCSFPHLVTHHNICSLGFSLTPTCVSISDVSCRTRPTAEAPAHRRLALDPRKARLTGAGCHMTVGCYVAPYFEMIGRRFMWCEDGDCLDKRCRSWCWGCFWTLGKRIKFVSICGELWFGQSVGQSCEGGGERQRRLWRHPGLELWLNSLWWRHFKGCGSLRLLGYLRTMLWSLILRLTSANLLENNSTHLGTRLSKGFSSWPGECPGDRSGDGNLVSGVGIE